MKFVIILLIIDFLLGTIAKQIFFSQETGKFARATHVIEDSEAKVMVFGSSHAHRHYVPKVFEQELQTTCYNAGAEGQQLLFHTALQQMVLKRSKPDLLLLNIDEDFLYSSREAYDRLADLHPYYSDHRDVLKPILEMGSTGIDFKLFFKSFQANSTLIHALRYYASPQLDQKGYRPLYGKVKPSKNLKRFENLEAGDDIDPNFVIALERFIAEAKDNGVPLVFVTSPNLLVTDYSNNESLSKIKEIARKEQVLLLDFFNSETFLEQYHLFHDTSHLNNDGAELFTKLVADRVKELQHSK